MRPRFAASLMAVLALAGSSFFVPAANAATEQRRPPKGGAYSGAEDPAEANGLDKVSISFRVNKRGTRVKSFVMGMNTICSYPLYLTYVQQPMPTAKIKKNGRFTSVLRETYNGDEIDITVTGRFKGRTVREGSIDYTVGSCVRTATWSAHRG